MKTSNEFIDPETLQAIESLKLRTKVLVRGLLKGVHRSVHRGGSVEFSEYRQYQPGDDIRHIDWKLFGRRDKYYIKEFESQTELTAYFIVDTSESMTYKAVNAPFSKFDYVAHLAATLTYVLLRQGDRVGLGTFSTRNDVQFLPASSSWSQLDRICEFFEGVRVGGETELDRALEIVGEHIDQQSVVFLVSDLLGADNDTYSLLGAMRKRGADVGVFHPLDPDELELPFEGQTRFKPVEHDDQLDVEAGSVRTDYQDRLRSFLDENESRFRELGVQYQWFSTLDPLEAVCRTFLGRRL